MPEKKLPMRKVKAPRPLIICPSVPSLAITVGVCGSFSPAMVQDESASTGPIACVCWSDSCSEPACTLADFSATVTVPIF